jgi:hypothetical protein
MDLHWFQINSESGTTSQWPQFCLCTTSEWLQFDQYAIQPRHDISIIVEGRTTSDDLWLIAEILVKSTNDFGNALDATSARPRNDRHDLIRTSFEWFKTRRLHSHLFRRLLTISRSKKTKSFVILFCLLTLVYWSFFCRGIACRENFVTWTLEIMLLNILCLDDIRLGDSWMDIW